MYLVKKLKLFINEKRQNLVSYTRKVKMRLTINTKQFEHLKPTYNCSKEWYGNSYGGFYVNPDLLNENSIVYSFGIGKDISFDKKIMSAHKCKVFGFDPTPKSIDYISSISKDRLFSFYPYGISTKTGVEKFYLPINNRAVSASLISNSHISSKNYIEVNMKNFNDISKQFNHKYIDIIKMDIEGAEYEVLETLINSEITIKQILVEFHDRLFYVELKSKKTTQLLYKHGFEIFASSFNYEEISFINTKI